MARIPILRDPGQLQTGNLTLRTPELTAVTNQAIAKGLGDVASVAMDISEKAKRAQDVTNLTTASMEMQKAQMEFADFQLKNPDESKWLDKWKEINTRLESEFGSLKLTPDARLDLNERFTGWSTRGTIQVQADAFKQAGRNMDYTIEAAATNRDYSSAEAGINAAVAKGLYTKQEGEAKLARLQKTKKDDLWNTYREQSSFLLSDEQRNMENIQKVEGLLDAAKDAMDPHIYEMEVANLLDLKDEQFVKDETVNSPEKVIKDLDKPEYAPNLKAPQQRERLKNLAMRRLEQLQQMESRDVLSGIVSGSIKDYKQAEVLMPRSDVLQKEKIKEIFSKMPPDKATAQIIKRTLETAVDSYDPTNDPDDEKEFAIVDLINRLNMYDEKLTSTIREKFYKKQQDRQPPSPLESEIGNHKKFLDMVFEPKLKALMDPKTGDVPLDKMQEFRSILSTRDKLAQDYEQVIKSGKISTREEAKDLSVKMLREPYSNAALDWFEYAPTATEGPGYDLNKNLVPLDR